MIHVKSKLTVIKSYRMSPDMLLIIHEEARRLGVSESALVRRSIFDSLKRIVKSELNKSDN